MGINQKFRRLAAVAAIALLPLAGGSAQAQTPTPQASDASGKIVIRESFPSQNALFWPNYVAQDMGFNAKEGIDVQKNFIDPNITVSSLIGNAMDISYADSTQIMFALDKGADLVSFGLSTDRQPYYLMAGPSITTLKELKGKKVAAASEIDVYTYVIKQILLKAGLNPDKDVEWIFGGNQTHRLAAIIANAIDSGLFAPPSDARLMKMGFHKLAFTPDYYPNLTLSAETVLRSYGQTHADTLRRFLRAEEAAVTWLNDPANKAQALQILEKETGSNADDSEEAYDYFIGKHVWTDACIHPSGMVNVIKIMRATDQLKHITEADVPKFTDTEWCSK